MTTKMQEESKKIKWKGFGTDKIFETHLSTIDLIPEFTQLFIN